LAYPEILPESVKRSAASLVYVSQCRKIGHLKEMMNNNKIGMSLGKTAGRAQVMQSTLRGY
jgi:hypothetical protein